MRTYFINPPALDQKKYIREGRCMQSVDSWATVWPPLTLAILATIARKYGETRLIDCNVEDRSQEGAAKEIADFHPDVVVVNASFPSFDSDSAFAHLVKETCPDAIVVGFGVLFTLLEEKALCDAGGYDVAIYGEPEETFDELLRSYRDAGKVAPVPGLMWREGKDVVKGPPRGFIKDLDTIPMAARDLLKNDRYRLPHNGRPFTLVNVARGCPYPCTFCIANLYYGKRMRHHSVGYVMREIESCITEYGIRDFLFWEEIFTLERDFGIEVCREIVKRKLGIAWATTTRADLVDREILEIMKAAGCELLGLGIESASQEILDRAKKGETVEDTTRAVRLCKEVGVRTMGHFIFGLPGETEETAQRTIKHMVKLGLDYMQCYCAVPYPKTPVWEMAMKNGWITAKHWSEYDFGGRSVMNLGTCSPDDVDRFRRTAFRKFYLRPRFILKQLKMLASFPRILQAASFLKWMKGAKPGKQ